MVALVAIPSEGQPPPEGGKAGRIGRGGAVYTVHDVLAFLRKQGLLTQVTSTSTRVADAVYRPRRRLLAHYRDLLVDELFAGIQGFATERPPAPPPPPWTAAGSASGGG